ncbi:MAG TPA: hypothetical protein VGM32_05270 [Rhodopila sp.]|jgi:hypothetical protein
MNRLAVAAVILVSTSWSAIAAPFCLGIQGAPPQCIYVDGNECAADAARQNGACVPNPANPPPSRSRMGEYCMILPIGFTHCGYADGNACAQDALKQHGVCTKSEGTLPQQVPDPFVPNAGR